MNIQRPILPVLAIALMCLTIAHVFAAPPGPCAPEANLIKILQSDAPVDQKSDACRQLERMGTKEAVPALAALLSHEQLSHKARAALEQINHPTVDDALRNAIGKLQGRPLIGVMQSIGHRRDAIAADALIRLLQDKDPDVASTAAYALGLIGTEDAGKALQAALLSAPDTLKPALCDAILRAAESPKAINAAVLYHQLMKPDLPPHVRAAASRGLLAKGAGLKPLLIDRDWAIFQMGLRLIAEGNVGPTGPTALESALDDLPPERKAMVIAVLDQRALKKLMPHIRPGIETGGPDLRIAAIQAAVRADDKESIPALLAATAAQDKRVADAAIAATVRMPGDQIDAALLAWLDGKDAARCLIAIDCLSRRQSTSAGPALLKAASAGDGPVRAAAIKALGEVGTAAELRPLLNLLLKADAEPDRAPLEQAAITLCANVTDKDASERVVIETLSAATQPTQKVMLLHILSSVGGAKSLQAMRTAAKDADAEVQETAIRALCNWPTIDVAPDLMQLAQNAARPNQRILALRGWLRLAADERLPAEKRLEMCQQATPLLQRPEEKRQLLAALALVPTTKSLAMITAQIDDPAVREEAASAAVGVAGKLTHPSSTTVDVPAILQAMEKVKQSTKNAKTLAAADGVIERAKQKK